MSSPTHHPVPFIDFSREYTARREEILAAITAVCDTQRFILGPTVERFESLAAAALSVEHAIGCSSGTDALWLMLAAANIGPGDLVLTTPFSFFATASAILRTGARPIFADIDPRTFNLAPDSVRETLAALELPTEPTKLALLPVHLYGQCADIDGLTSALLETGFSEGPTETEAIFEDAAQAWGAKWNGVPAGALGRAAAFSFYPTKNLAAAGEAGLVTTNDTELAKRAIRLRAHGMEPRYFHSEIGWNSRLDAIQAAVLEVRLRYVDTANARRREIAALYDRLFREASLAAPEGSHDIADGIVLPWTDPRAEHVFHQYVIRAPRRDALRAHLTAHSIGSEIFYPLSLHQQQALSHLNYQPGQFPIAERAANEVLALPIFPELRDDEVHTVVEAIRRFYKEKG